MNSSISRKVGGVSGRAAAMGLSRPACRGGDLSVRRVAGCGKHSLSRRRFLQVAGAGAGGAMLAGGLASPQVARAALDPATPKPIPGGFVFGGELFHNLGPGVFDPVDTEPSGIFDFKGDVAYAIVDGTGTGIDPQKGEMNLTFEADLRFMQGDYVAIDGNTRFGTFAVI